MKYHIVSGGSPAGSLKYYFKMNNINDIIINHSDDLSIWPIHIDFSDRCKWIKNNLFPWDNLDDSSEISKYLDETHNNFLEYVSHFTDEDDIYIWHWENIIEKMMFYRLCSEIKKWNIYSIFVWKEINKHWFYPRATWECSPKELWKLINEWIKILEDDKKTFSKNFSKIKKEKSNLKIIENWKIKSINDSFYDNDLLKYTSNENFISAAKIVWSTMWNSEQLISDSFLQYRLKYLIDDKKIITQWKLDSLRNFKIKKIK